MMKNLIYLNVIFITLGSSLLADNGWGLPKLKETSGVYKMGQWLGQAPSYLYSALSKATSTPSNIAHKISWAIWKPNTRLIQAAKDGDLAGIQEALQEGADPEFRDLHDINALGYATLHGHKDAENLLKQHGSFLPDWLETWLKQIEPADNNKGYTSNELKSLNYLAQYLFYKLKEGQDWLRYSRKIGSRAGHNEGNIARKAQELSLQANKKIGDAAQEAFNAAVQAAQQERSITLNEFDVERAFLRPFSVRLNALYFLLNNLNKPYLLKVTADVDPKKAGTEIIPLWEE